MRVAICDDEKQDLFSLMDAVKIFDETHTLEISSFNNAAQLYEEHTKKHFDIAILDIEMPPPNGYDIAKQLVNHHHTPIIIFLTQSMAYTLLGYGIAFRYLAKPINQEQLNSALWAAIREASARQFVFSCDGISHVVRINDIHYFEVFDHYTILHTTDQAYRFRATLKEVSHALPYGYFGSPHQSYLVHFACIKAITPKEIYLTDGTAIPISRRKQQRFNHEFYSYLRR